MNGHTDSRERAVHGQLLAQSSHVARKEGDQAEHSSQVSGSWVPVSPRDKQLLLPWQCLLLGDQSQRPCGPGMCLHDSTLG